MNSLENRKSNPKRFLLVVLILAAVIFGFLLYQPGILGIGNSCNALRTRYESAKEKEDYGEVSKYYQKMNDFDCEF